MAHAEAKATAAGWYRYGFFIRGPGNSLHAAGKSFARTPNSYKEGQSLGIKNGVEGIVVSVMKVDEPKPHEFDVIVVVEEQDRSGAP